MYIYTSMFTLMQNVIVQLCAFVFHVCIPFWYTVHCTAMPYSLCFITVLGHFWAAAMENKCLHLVLIYNIAMHWAQKHWQFCITFVHCTLLSCITLHLNSHAYHILLPGTWSNANACQHIKFHLYYHLITRLILSLSSSKTPYTNLKSSPSI